MPTVHKVRMPKRSPAAGLTAPNQGRENPNRDVYGSARWKRTSKQHLERNPLCVHCQAKSKATPATITDHIKPINQGGEAFDSANHQSLCLKCHQKKSAKERHQAKAQ